MSAFFESCLSCVHVSGDYLIHVLSILLCCMFDVTHSLTLSLCQLSQGNKSVSNAAVEAYGRTLSKHHNWIVRGIFTMAMKSVPNYDTFMKTLGPADCADVLQDMHVYATALQTLLGIINSFAESQGLLS